MEKKLLVFVLKQCVFQIYHKYLGNELAHVKNKTYSFS
jgi:hypothetical protein